jgi:hypothetical protein
VERCAVEKHKVNMNKRTLNSMFPITACFCAIEARWTSLDANIPFPTLKEHVCNKIAGLLDDQSYRPAFIVPDADRLWHRDIRTIKGKQVAALETAVALSVAVTLKVPKSTATLLASIEALCRLFDELAVAQERIIQKRHDDRVRGGRARQDRLRPAREYALRLFESMRPPEGWKNVRMAARTIAPQVEAFVARHRFSVFAGDSTIRTIRGWLLEAQRAI